MCDVVGWEVGVPITVVFVAIALDHEECLNFFAYTASHLKLRVLDFTGEVRLQVLFRRVFPLAEGHDFACAELFKEELFTPSGSNALRVNY